MYKHGLLPKYVSPSIYKINDDTTDNITNYEPLHLALVSALAYGFKAHIRKSCKDTEPICMNQLAQTALDKANQGKILLNRLLAFSGIDGMYIPIPETFGRNHIWNYSARVAAGSGASINTNLSTPQKRIQQLNKLLFFTKQ